MNRLLSTLGTLSVCAATTFSATALDLKLVADGFVSPLICESIPGANGQLIVGDQAGTLHVLGKDGVKRDKLFLDLRPKMAELKKGFDERGLLGFAFHPKFKENGKFYVFYTAPRGLSASIDWDSTSRVSEFITHAGDPTMASANSERVILEIDQPFFNHNGGSIAFGPDGFLYIASGDGGSGNDQGKRGPLGNAQDRWTLMGKILRIDVDNAQPYSVPKDNPFADGKNGRPEIWAYGVRNPWRMHFDMGGDRKLIWGEVGQTMFEEVNIGQKGGNYGWNIREAFHGFNPNNPKEVPEKPTKGADGEPLIDPILEYKNIKGYPKDPEALGISITGGYIYRGKAIPSLESKYIFGDWQGNWPLPGGALFVATPPADGPGRWSMERLNIASAKDGKIKNFIVAFGQDDEGEVYVLTNDKNGLIDQTGKIWKLVP